MKPDEAPTMMVPWEVQSNEDNTLARLLLMIDEGIVEVDLNRAQVVELVGALLVATRGGKVGS